MSDIRKITSQQTFTIIDNKTGEVVDDNAMFIGKKAFLDKGFRKIFVGFLKDVVMDKDIAGKSIRLLLWIIENLKPNSLQIYIHYEDVCKELEISQKTFYNWINTLTEKGYIEEVKPKIYELVPFTAVNGQMSKAIEKSLK